MKILTTHWQEQEQECRDYRSTNTAVIFRAVSYITQREWKVYVSDESSGPEITEWSGINDEYDVNIEN